MQVAVIGLGTMGPGIAAVLERAGMSVRAFDTSAQQRGKAAAFIEAARVGLDKLGLPRITPTEPLAICEDLQHTLRDAELVIENVPEELTIKRDVLDEVARQVDAQCIIASGTSGIPIGDLQRDIKNPARVIGMHWSNPPHLIPIIEVVPGALTSSASIEWMTRFVKTIHMMPIKVKKDVPGFVENRILYSVMREAIDLVERGVIDAEDLDTCVSWGIGFKLSVIGPLALLDVAGLDIYQAVASYLNRELCTRSDVPSYISTRTAQGKLGIKAGAGVFDYTQDRIDALRETRVARLIAARRVLQDDE